MGWQPTGDAEVLVRRLDASGPVERIFENFSRHIREMVLQSARLVRVRWEDGLAAFLDRVEGGASFASCPMSLNVVARRGGLESASSRWRAPWRPPSRVRLALVSVVAI
jgi:hypothetical protein